MKRILTKLFLFTLGFIFISSGSYFIAAGYAHSDPDRVYTAKIPLPHSKTLAQFARKHIVHTPESLRDHLRIYDHGLLVPMAAVGSLFALIGLILILNSLFRFKLDPNESLKSKKESNHISSDFIRSINPDASDEVAPPVATVRAGETISFDESMLDVEEDPFEALRDVSNLVTMSQAYIEPRDSERIISMFRSDLLPYVHVVMDDQSMNRLAHQILESVIFRHKRQQEDITADQFQQQDKRVYESESETFLRRYMPAADKIRSAEMQECAGKTYDLVAQATVQKRFLSEPEDWEDISLRNAVEILAKDLPKTTSLALIHTKARIMRSIAILGGGVWGKAFGNAIAANNSICFWDRDISIAETVNGAFYQNLPDAIATAELIIIAVSSNGFADILKQLTAHYSQAAVPMPPVMWLTKGFVEQSRLLSESAAVHLPPNACFGAISGPTFAQEINRHLPAALALAVNQPQELPALQKLLHRKNLRFYPSQDLIGVCIGGALKNVIAIAAGISDGLNLGENARAAIITRGLAEMAAFNHQLGGQAATMQGVAGVGDLLLTCTSDLSRNRQFGIAIGCAQKPSTATAEGVTASAGAHFRATQIALDMPICNAVYQVLHENMPPLEAVESLLSRPPPKI